MSKLLQLQKNSMRERPTYESLLNDTVLNPKDRIALPNRRATQLRNTQYLAMWDDPQFLDLDKQAKNITINQIHNNEVHNTVQQSPDKTRAEETAMQNPPKPPDAPAPPPKQYPPVPKFSQGSQTTEDTAMQTGSGKPPPPAGGGSVKAKVTATSSTQTAQQFDMTIDDDLDDRHDDFKKFLAEHEQLKKAQQQSITQQIANHLGPHSSSADQSYVSRLVEERRGRSRDRSRPAVKPRTQTPDVEMEANNDAPPPPPPPAGGLFVLKATDSGGIKKVPVKLKPKQLQRQNRKPKNDDDAIMVESNNKPPPDNPPAPIVVKIPKSRSPRRGRSANPHPRAAATSGTPAPTATTAIKQDKAPLAGAGPLPPKPKARAKSEVPEPQKPPAPKPIDTSQKRAASVDVPRPTKKTNAQQVSEKPKPSKAPAKPSKAPAKPSKAPDPPSPPKPADPPSPPKPADPPSSSTSRSRSRTAPLIAPSRISLSAVARELQKLVDMKVVKENDAVRTITLVRELNKSPPPARRKEIQRELVGIYSDNYKAAKAA